MQYVVRSYYIKDKTLTITDEGLLFWWAHQDLNLGPKDYESRYSAATPLNKGSKA
jgi:hypothetical protein